MLACACALVAYAVMSIPGVLGSHARDRTASAAAPNLPGLQPAPGGAAGTRPGGRPPPVPFGVDAPSFVWTGTVAEVDAVRAQGGIVLDLNRRQVAWSRDARARRAPASLTKMMTAMVAFDHAGSLDRTVRVPPEATEVEPNVMGLSAGEEVDLRTLFYGLFLDSGNDAAETLARTLVPRADFLAEMNSRAARLGLRDTHFSNPSGLDDPALYSSAYDLGVIAATLVDRYPALVEIAGTRERSIPAVAGRHKAFDPVNLNKMLWTYPGTVGLKTGFTDEAGGCVVVAVNRGGRRLIAVMLHSDVFFTDAARMLDRALAD